MITGSSGPANRGSYFASSYYERGGVEGAGSTSDAMSALLARNWWVIALRGALAILFGIIALFLPEATMLALVLLFAAYMLVDGVLAIVAGVRALGATIDGDG